MALIIPEWPGDIEEGLNQDEIQICIDSHVCESDTCEVTFKTATGLSGQYVRGRMTLDPAQYELIEDLAEQPGVWHLFGADIDLHSDGSATLTHLLIEDTVVEVFPA